VRCRAVNGLRSVELIGHGHGSVRFVTMDLISKEAVRRERRERKRGLVACFRSVSFRTGLSSLLVIGQSTTTTFRRSDSDTSNQDIH
jgi:hypothetical protein